jgi:hypothetical protein
VTTVNNQRKALLSIANKSNDIEVRMQNSISVSDMKLMTQQKALGEYICWVIPILTFESENSHQRTKILIEKIEFFFV